MNFLLHLLIEKKSIGGIFCLIGVKKWVEFFSLSDKRHVHLFGTLENSKKMQYVVVSVRLWNFKDGGS